MALPGNSTRGVIFGVDLRERADEKKIGGGGEVEGVEGGNGGVERVGEERGMGLGDIESGWKRIYGKRNEIRECFVLIGRAQNSG